MNRELPNPSEVCDLGLNAEYGDLEFRLISKGYLSQSMDEKWDIVYEEPWLHFHRSWTGRGVYGLRFQYADQRAVVIESWVVRGGAEGYTEDLLSFHRDLVRFLIDAILLRKVATFRRLPGELVGPKRVAMAQVLVGHIPVEARGEKDRKGS